MFGFPGETDKDFMATLAVMQEVRFDYAFLYRYSEREGTKAFTLGNNIPEHIRIDRLKEAISLQQSISRARNSALIGTESDVLVKEPSKDGKGWMGFTGANIPVVFTANGNSVGVGSFVRVKVNTTTGASLVGEAI
jgi:tRNA-2-methylthio-N6-dimethylallyladenosine synthase